MRQERHLLASYTSSKLLVKYRIFKLDNTATVRISCRNPNSFFVCAWIQSICWHHCIFSWCSGLSWLSQIDFFSWARQNHFTVVSCLCCRCHFVGVILGYVSHFYRYWLSLVFDILQVSKEKAKRMSRQMQILIDFLPVIKRNGSKRQFCENSIRDANHKSDSQYWRTFAK